MRYLALLTLVYSLFSGSQFRTRQLFDLIQADPEFYSLMSHANAGSKARSERSLLASLSADLNRLYAMRFLKRNRQRRTTVLATGGGRSWPLGYEYVYQISNQGMGYLRYKNFEAKLSTEAYVSREMIGEGVDKEVSYLYAILIKLGIKPPNKELEKLLRWQKLTRKPKVASYFQRFPNSKHEAILRTLELATGKPLREGESSEEREANQVAEIVNLKKRVKLLEDMLKAASFPETKNGNENRHITEPPSKKIQIPEVKLQLNEFPIDSKSRPQEEQIWWSSDIHETSATALPLSVEEKLKIVDRELEYQRSRILDELFGAKTIQAAGAEKTDTEPVMNNTDWRSKGKWPS